MTEHGPESGAVDESSEQGAGESVVSRLPCGRDGIDLVDRARAGRTGEHEAHCPHCQAELAQAELADRAARDLAALEREVAAPASLLPGVMRNVWNELRRAIDIELPTAGGNCFVTDRAIVSMLQLRLDELLQLQVHTCRVRIVDADQAVEPAAGAEQGGLRVEVTAAAGYNTDLPTVAGQAQAAAADVLRHQFGLVAQSIDIDIVDVFVPGGAP